MFLSYFHECTLCESWSWDKHGSPQLSKEITIQEFSIPLSSDGFTTYIGEIIVIRFEKALWVSNVRSIGDFPSCKLLCQFC